MKRRIRLKPRTGPVCRSCLQPIAGRIYWVGEKPASKPYHKGCYNRINKVGKGQQG